MSEGKKALIIWSSVILGITILSVGSFYSYYGISYLIRKNEAYNNTPTLNYSVNNDDFLKFAEANYSVNINEKNIDEKEKSNEVANKLSYFISSDNEISKDSIQEGTQIYEVYYSRGGKAWDKEEAKYRFKIDFTNDYLLVAYSCEYKLTDFLIKYPSLNTKDEKAYKLTDSNKEDLKNYLDSLIENS